MNEEIKRQGFVEAILAEPMASDHRLVFADWLEDRGELEEAQKYLALHGTAAIWCGNWGKDGYGLWCDLAIGEVTQCLRWIPPGSFWVERQEVGGVAEGQRARMEISRGFWMFDTPCTQGLWEAVMGSNPSHFRGPHVPWKMWAGGIARIFCQKSTARSRGWTYDSPRSHSGSIPPGA